MAGTDWFQYFHFLFHLWIPRIWVLYYVLEIVCIVFDFNHKARSLIDQLLEQVTENWWESFF